MRDKFTRVMGQLDATWFADLGGKHEFKAGIQYDKVSNDVLDRETGNLNRIYWGSSLGGVRGAYGYYRLRTNTFDPERGFMTVGNTSSNNLGLFLQDSWTIGDKLTLNLGIRTERERVPNFNPDDPAAIAHGFTEDVPLFEFGFGDKIAPRLGFAYDLKGDGKTKLYGSWGLFYDIFKLALPRGSFGGDKWVDVFYTLETPNPADLANCVVNAEGTSGVNCPGTQIRPPVDFRHPSFDYLEYDADGKPVLDPYRLQEWSGGIEHSLTSNSSVALRYVHKQIDKAIEDIGFLDAQGNEVYLIGNPGFNANEVSWVLEDGTQIPGPKAVRDYDGVEAIYNRRLANRWALRLSYLWSRLEGNYSGLAQADEPGRADPNVGRLFDYPILMFDQTGNAAFGPLPTDRPHQVKAQFIYETGFGLSAGLNAYVASGSPITREAAFIPPNNFPVQYLGRGSDGRTPTLSTFDLNLMQDIKLGGRPAAAADGERAEPAGFRHGDQRVPDRDRGLSRRFGQHHRGAVLPWVRRPGARQRRQRSAGSGSPVPAGRRSSRTRVRSVSGFGSSSSRSADGGPPGPPFLRRSEGSSAGGTKVVNGQGLSRSWPFSFGVLRYGAASSSGARAE